MLKEISPVEEEKIIVANDFGTVSTKRVMLKVSNTEASIPIKQIYSISFRRKHNFSLGILYLFISIAVLIGELYIENSYETEGVSMPKLISVLTLILILLFFIVSMTYFIGHHLIRINEFGDDRKKIKVDLFKTRQGKEYYEAIHQQIIGG